MAEDYSKWSYEELSDEIKREEEALARHRATLSEATRHAEEIRRAIEEEKLAYWEDRYRTRIKRIEELERVLSEYDLQVRRQEERVRRREETIQTLEASIAFQSRRLLTAWLSPTERFITREVITRLRRSLTAHRGWLTRETRTLESLKRFREWIRRRIAGYKAWQVREEPLLKRLEELRTALATTTAEIERFKAEITAEEAKLEEKRKYLPKFYKTHIIISFAYQGENYFEVHEIIPHLSEEVPIEFAQDVAYDILVNYGIPDTFLKILGREVSIGAVQTKGLKEFPEETHATIFDVHAMPRATRQSFKLKWRYTPAWTEVLITGERIEHPAEVEYVSIEPIEKTMEEEELKKEWEEEK